MVSEGVYIKHSAALDLGAVCNAIDLLASFNENLMRPTVNLSRRKDVHDER